MVMAPVFPSICTDTCMNGVLVSVWGTLGILSTVWTHLPFGFKRQAREGMKLRTHRGFFKIHCLQNILPFAFSVARHSHKPFIANHFSWSTIRVMNILNEVNLFCRRRVVMTCMLRFVPEGLQTIIKGADSLEHERNLLQINWQVICLKFEICFQRSRPCCLSILFINWCCC